MVDISPLTLLIGSDIIKIVLKVNNLGFVLNERLTVTDHFRRCVRRCVRRYIRLSALWGHIHGIHRLKLGRGWLCHLLCLTLDMGVLCMLVRMLHRNGGWIWLLEPIYSTFILWGGLIMCPTWRQVLWALRWQIMLGFSFCRFFTKYCMSGIRAICFRYLVLLRLRVQEAS
jgi:hypothetical protein